MRRPHYWNACLWTDLIAKICVVRRGLVYVACALRRIGGRWLHSGCTSERKELVELNKRCLIARAEGWAGAWEGDILLSFVTLVSVVHLAGCLLGLSLICLLLLFVKSPILKERYLCIVVCARSPRTAIIVHYLTSSSDIFLED